MEHIRLLNKGMFGGILIAIAACAYVSCDNPVVGACFFAFGLMAICVVQAKLYTGVIGYIFTNTYSHSLGAILEILFGNIIGVFAIVSCVKFSKLDDDIGNKINAIATAKMNDGLLSLLFLSILCGICVYIGVAAYAKRDSASTVVLFLAVAVFIICGFEHSIADIFYLAYSGKLFSLTGVLFFLIVLFGNSFGAIYANSCLEG